MWGVENINETFNSFNELVNYVLERGIDPNYRITNNGRITNEYLIDSITY